MPVVKVCTAKYLTVPKSAKVSIKANATPPAIAGRASGSETRRKLCQGDRPSDRATSIIAPPRSMKAVRAIR
jgi:hypothetical protein